MLLLALAAAYLATRTAWPSRADIGHQDQPELETAWRGVHEDRPEVSGGGASLWQTLRLPVAWLSMLLFIAYTGVELGIGQWAFPLLVSARGPGTVEAGPRRLLLQAAPPARRVFFCWRL